MDGGAWWAAVHGVAKSQTRLSDFTFTFHFHTLEKEMATHSSVLAWRIPGTGEPGGLPSLGSHRVRQDWSDLAAESEYTYGIRMKISFSLTVVDFFFTCFSITLKINSRVFSFYFSYWLQIRKKYLSQYNCDTIWYYKHNKGMCVLSRSVVSDSLWPYGL